MLLDSCLTKPGKLTYPTRILAFLLHYLATFGIGRFLLEFYYFPQRAQVTLGIAVLSLVTAAFTTFRPPFD